MSSVQELLTLYHRRGFLIFLEIPDSATFRNFESARATTIDPLTGKIRPPAGGPPEGSKEGLCRLSGRGCGTPSSPQVSIPHLGPVPSCVSGMPTQDRIAKCGHFLRSDLFFVPLPQDACIDRRHDHHSRTSTTLLEPDVALTPYIQNGALLLFWRQLFRCIPASHLHISLLRISSANSLVCGTCHDSYYAPAHSESAWFHSHMSLLCV